MTRGLNLTHFAMLALSLLMLGLPAGSPADEYIKIGAWNIENLGGRNPGQIPAALAEHLVLADVDLLALEEIWDTDSDAATMTNSKLDETFQRMNEEQGHDWTYLLFPNRTSEKERHTGVAWNRNRLTRVGDPMPLNVEFANVATWNRRPHAVQFSVAAGKSDFVVVPLHMKSNRVDDALADLPSPVEIRQQEAQALVQQLPGLRDHFQDQDVILLGDLNCLAADEAALATYAAAGFVDLNPKDAVTYAKGMYLSPFDRILVTANQPELRFSRQYILSPAEPLEHLRKHSDHFLVLTAMRVLADDDE